MRMSRGVGVSQKLARLLRPGFRRLSGAEERLAHRADLLAGVVVIHDPVSLQPFPGTLRIAHRPQHLAVEAALVLPGVGYVAQPRGRSLRAAEDLLDQALELSRYRRLAQLRSAGQVDAAQPTAPAVVDTECAGRAVLEDSVRLRAQRDRIAPRAQDGLELSAGLRGLPQQIEHASD